MCMSVSVQHVTMTLPKKTDYPVSGPRLAASPLPDVLMHLPKHSGLVHLVLEFIGI